MLLPFNFLALAVPWAVAALAGPLPFGDFQTKHAWPVPPKNWAPTRPAPADHPLNIRIGLKQHRIDALVDHLYAVSDPSHDHYGMHLSKAQVDDLVRPADDSVRAVDEWLLSHGVDMAAVSRSSAGDWVNVVLPVGLVEKMLDTKYHVYTHTPSSNSIVRTLAYSLPRSLHGHIDVITPTTMFGRFHEMRKTSFIMDSSPVPPVDETAGGTIIGQSGEAVPTSCNNAITPSCLMALYGTTNYTPVSTSNNSIGIAGYLDEFANVADLKTFAQKFRPAAVNATFKVVQVNGGGNDQNEPGVEANLDIQTTTGLTFPTPNTYFSTAGSPPFDPDSQTPTDTNEPYDQFLNFLLNGSTVIPPVISTSYGDDEQTVPSDFAIRVCNSFAQLGTMGKSVLFSSGDAAVGGGDCQTNDGTNKTLFQPDFPASCPFVTTVGATTHVNPETAVDFSGGGFSRLFVQPSYQTSAVNAFLTKLGATNEGLFNASGRGYPDVAAQGTSFQVVIGGSVSSVGGTSASCPTVSSVVTLLNDFRISKGKPTLGFLNPLLYANPSALNDITSGSNPGCGTDGFTAGTGWDPVTGLGTPNFPKLQAIV